MMLCTFETETIAENSTHSVRILPPTWRYRLVCRKLIIYEACIEAR